MWLLQKPLECHQGLQSLIANKVLQIKYCMFYTCLVFLIMLIVTGYLLQKEEECIGFATLPDQIHRKVIKKGFHFTIMVVGK